MKKNAVLFLFALCPLVPATGRFAYGIVIAVAFFFLYLCGIGFRNLVSRFAPGPDSLYIELVCLAAAATVFQLILRGLSPVLAASLELSIFLTAFSCILLVSIDHFSPETESFMPVVSFIPLVLVFSAVRELAGFGTISIPTAKGLAVFSALPVQGSAGFAFLGTAGGALILLGVLAWITKYLNRRKQSAERKA